MQKQLRPASKQKKGTEKLASKGQVVASSAVIKPSAKTQPRHQRIKSDEVFAQKMKEMLAVQQQKGKAGKVLQNNLGTANQKQLLFSGPPAKVNNTFQQQPAPRANDLHDLIKLINKHSLANRLTTKTTDKPQQPKTMYTFGSLDEDKHKLQVQSFTSLNK